VSTNRAITLIAGLLVVLAIAAVVSLIVSGKVVALALAGGAIAYGIFAWNSQRMARFEESMEEEESSNY
jgi:hypothetical protein